MDNRYTENQVVAKEFEMQVNEVATSIDARTVPSVPMLLDHQSGQESCVTPSVGKRNMIDKKMYNGVKVDFWVCLNFSSLHSGFASRFSTELVNMCVGKGMNFNMGPVFPARAFSPLKIGKPLADVASIASKAQKQLQLMILILPDHSESYGEIERICQTELDIIVQCCELRFISSISRMEYSEKVALEINAKVLTKYRSSVSAQGPREETIKDACKVVNDPKRGLETDASDNGSTFNSLYTENQVVAKEFEMQVNEVATSIDAITVPVVPMLQDHQSGQESCVTPSVGKRNMIDKKKMYNGVKVDFWVCLNFSSLHSGLASRFSTELVNMCVGKGMNFNMVPVFPARAFSPLKIGKALADVASIASKAQKQLQLMIIILPDHSESYGEIERICQTELDIIVQCCELRFISSISIMRMEYSEKIALEINAKVLTKYRSSVSAQGPREEAIKDVYKVVNDPKRSLEVDASDNGSTSTSATG